LIKEVEVFKNEKKKWEETQEKISNINPTADEIVNLNVGGTHITTTRNVLTSVKDSLLS